MKTLENAVCSLCILAITSPMLAASKRRPPKSLPSWFWGCWVVGSQMDVPTAVFGLSIKEAESIPGTRLIYARSWARSGRTTLRPTSYSVRVLTSEEFLEDHHGSASEVDLPQIGIHGPSVTEVEVALPANLSDVGFPGNDLYLRKRDIVIEVENAFFPAEKAMPGDPQCARAATGIEQNDRGKQF